MDARRKGENEGMGRVMDGTTVLSSSFGATVRRLREQKGIGLRKFAQQVAMSPTYLSKVERDEFNPPSEEKVLAIAEAMGTDADVLLGLAGRVASDLAGIIQREPRGMATLLRAANGLSSDELTKLADEIRHRKPSKYFGDKLIGPIAALEALRDSHAEFVRKVREFAENMQTCNKAYNTGRVTAKRALIAICAAELARGNDNG